MKVVGSKTRSWKHIAPIILANRREGQLYVEPFCGGANSFQHVANPRLGADVHPYLVATLTAARDGWTPPDTITEAEYKAVKADMDAYPPELVGFVGFGCSFGAKWWGGYARGNVKSKKILVDGQWVVSRIPANYARESHNQIIRQAPKLQGATILHSTYQDLHIPDGSLCYLDPPYAKTLGYKGTPNFDHAAFWQWAGELAQRCTVFVSEYTAPDGWACVWEREQTTNLTNLSRAIKATERLFTMK